MQFFKQAVVILQLTFCYHIPITQELARQNTDTRMMPQKAKSDQAAADYTTFFTGPVESAPNSQPRPDLYLPENLSPNHLIQVAWDAGKWRAVISKVRDMLTYKASPTTVTVGQSLSPIHAISVSVTPMHANEHQGKLQHYPFSASVSMKDKRTTSFLDRSQHRANLDVAVKYLKHKFIEQTKWRKISGDPNNPFDRVVFEIYDGVSVEMYDFLSDLHFQINNFPKASTARVLEELRLALEFCSDLLVQLHIPENQNEHRLFLQDPIVEPINQPRTQKENGMIGGFDLESMKVEVSGYSLADLGGNPAVVEEIRGLTDLFLHSEHFARFGSAARPPLGKHATFSF